MNLISAYAEGLSRGDSGHEYPGYNGDTVHDLMIDIEDKQYNFLTADFVLAVADKLPTGINMNVRELNSLVIEALNDEFLRARLGGMYDTVEDCRDMFFRVSGSGFDWTAVIKRFVRENAVRIDNITVLWDYESTGRKDFFKDEKGRDINKIPIVVIKVFGYVVLCERMLEVAVGFKYLFNACQSQLFGFRTVHVLFTSAILYL